MPKKKNGVAVTRFADAESAAGVPDLLTRIEDLIAGELGVSGEAVRDALPDARQVDDGRLRPLFTVLAAQFGPTPDAWQVTVSGAALELIHLATVCHDDVSDGDGVRRAGSNTRQANNNAILAGDYRFATASKLGARLGQRGFQVVAEAFAELITGKMREMLGAATDGDPVEHYLRCVREKEGSLVAAAGQLGATFAGASEEESLRLSRLGRLIGTASQIADDNVDIVGALRRGVYNLPVLYGLQGEGRDADRLRTALAAPIDDPNVAQAVASARSSSGMAAAEKVVAGYAAMAHEELSLLPDCPGRRALSKLIDDLISARV